MEGPKLENFKLASVSAIAPKAPAPEKVKGLNQALEDFESLFAASLLRTSRESSGGGWLGGESSGGNDGIMEFAEQNIAKAISSTGAFGIAKSLRKSMDR